MNCRERVMKALNHEEADQVPVVFGGSAQKFSDPLIKDMARRFHIEETEFAWVFSGFRFSLHSEALWNRLRIDSRYINWHHEEGYTLETQGSTGKYVNSWGIVIENAAMSLERKPLQEATVADVERFPWPRPGMSTREKDSLRAKARSYRDSGFPVFAYRPIIGGIFTVSRMLRGDEQFYMDLIADEPLVEALFRRVTDTQEAFYRTFLDAVGDLIDVIEIEDDLGGQETSLISPMMYDRLLKPFHKELISFIKRKSPRVKVMIHCDGSIRNLLPSFIEIGIDILNPVQTNIGGMDLAGLKRDFGKDIVFQGAIDVQHVLARGTPQQVRDEVRRVIEILAPGGGYLLGSTQNMTADIPLGNVLAMFEAASTFCRY